LRKLLALEAQHNWAITNSNNKGLPRDCQEAAQWLAKISGQGFRNSSDSIELGTEVPVGPQSWQVRSKAKGTD
jgi:hypothetical protein